MNKKKINDVYVIPDALLTTSRNPGNFTDRIVKTFSALLGSPILRRGKDSLGDIAFNAKQNSFHNLIIVHKVKKKGLSTILLYKLIEKYYKKLGTLKYEIVNFKDVRTPYDAIQISMKKEGKPCASFSNFLQSFFLSYPKQKVRSKNFKVEIKTIVSLTLIPDPQKGKKYVRCTFKDKNKKLLTMRGYIESEE